MSLLARHFKKLFIFQYMDSLSANILMEIENLDSNLSMRRKNALIYQHILSDDKFIKPRYQNDTGTYCFYGFLTKNPKRRRSLIKKMALHGVNIGPLYDPPLSKIFGTAQKNPQADFISKRFLIIINDIRKDFERNKFISQKINKS